MQEPAEGAKPKQWMLQSVELSNLDTGVFSLYHCGRSVEVPGGVEVSRVVSAQSMPWHLRFSHLPVPYNKCNDQQTVLYFF